MQLIKAIESALISLKKVSSVEIAGQNSKLNTYKKIWIGKPSWQEYKVHLPNGEERKEKHKSFNLPRYITRGWANNYANEDTTITIPKQSDDVLKEILASNNFWGKWNNFVEAMMGLGVAGIVENLDSWNYENDNLVKGDSKVKIQFVRAERVFPITIDDGEVTECAFVTYKTGGCKIVIHWLNEKEKYMVSELKGTGKNGDYRFDFKEITTIDLGTKIPLFQCLTPNITNDEEDEYGTSVLDKAFNAFEQCDVDYTALYKEIKLGGKIKFVATELVKTDTNGNQSSLYDLNDESIFAIDKGNMDKNDFKTFTDDLRVQQLITSINFNMNLAAMLCGLGSNQFEFDGTTGRPVQTATGVIAKQTELYRNVIKQENYATSKLKDMVKAIAFLNDTYTNNAKIGEIKDSDVQITYDDNIVEDTDSKRKNDLAEVNAGVMTTAEYRATWYDEDLDSAKKFMQDNAMLLDKYTLALQSKVITPAMFVDFVFGEDYKNKTELVAYIKESQKTPDNTPFIDESDNDDNEGGADA